MSAVNFIISLARKILARESKGITTIPNRMVVERKAGEIAATLQNAGLPLNRADEFIRSEQDLVGILNQIEAIEKKNLAENIRGGIRDTKTAKIFNTAGEELDPNQPIIGGTQPGKKIDQDTFRRLAETNTQRIKQRISDKKVETEAEILARIEKENKEAAERLREKRIKEKMDDINEIEDPEDMATGGRAGFKSGLGMKFLKFLNENNPVQAYKKYLKSVKDRTLAGKELEVAGEVIPIAAGGALITNQLKKKLKSMNEEQKKKIKEEAEAELREDKAYGGRIGYKDGPTFDFAATGSKSGKQQIEKAPAGITRDQETFQAIMNADIPLNDKLNFFFYSFFS